MHELSESTRKVIDAGSAVLVAAAAGTAALTLADWALIVTIIAGLLSAAWQILRFYDRFRHGYRPSAD